MKKRILSLLLAFAMTLSMIPVQTFAEDTAAACPTCGEMGCMTHCQICGSDACETFHVQCSDCGAYDCTADHTASATEGATEKPTEQPTQAPTEGATQPAQSPVASIAETDETTVDNCPYCEETTAEDGTVTHAEGCNAAYVYDGTADVGKYAKLNEYYADSTVIVFDGTEELIFNYSDFEGGLIFKITDWNWDSETTALWYKVEAYSGTFPADMPGEPWMLQNYTNSSEEDSLLFVTIEEPTDPTEAPTEEPEDTCDICADADCTGLHFYCDICAAYDCGKTHLYCNTHDKYDCTETHVWCGTCGKYNCGQTHENVYKPVTAPVIPANPTLTEGADVSIVDEYGGAVTEEGFALIEGIKSSLSAWTELEGVSYQWQVCYDSENDLWADIQGQTGRGILLSPAMLLNAMEDADSVSIRCVASTESQTLISEAIPVSIASPAAKLGLVPSSASAAVDTTAEDAEVAEKVNLIINYQFANGDIAANPWTAEVASGDAISQTVTVPTIAGYVPTFTATNNVTLTDNTLTVNYAAGELTQTTNLYVTYQPTNVNVTVYHYWQNVDNDNYTLHETETMELLNGSTVGDVHNTYPGFYNLLYEKPVVAADGSTVVEVYYDRYYYLMKFDLSGGYGTDPIYARYGATIGDVGAPTRAGYTFQHWTLNGETATIPTTMPNENRTYVAVWEAQTTTYDVVFWYENADDDHYAQAGVINDVSVTSGTIVNGSSYANTNFEGRDSTHFTYSHADENVEVKGDGSTVVNVYFSRNVYDLTFVMSDTADNCTVPIHAQHTDYTGDCYTLDCTLAHIHEDACQRTLNCSISVHTDHTSACLICEKTEHAAHTGACLKCGKTEHTAHTDACLKCGETEHTHSSGCCSITEHTHTISCCNAHTGLAALVHLGGLQDDCNTGNCGNQQEHTHDGTSCDYCDLEEHPHTDACYSDEIHTHDEDCYNDEIHTHDDGCYSDEIHTHDEDCYTYQCGALEHTHVEACYELTCDYLHYHQNGDCYLVITRKYDADISDVWKENPVKAVIDAGNAFTWSETDAQVSFMEKMPGTDSTMTLYEYSGNRVYHWFYYLEVLPGMDTTGLTLRTDDGKVYYQYDDSTIKHSGTLYLTYDDDYYPITGFDQRYEKGEGGWYSSGSSYRLDFVLDEDNEEYRAYLYYVRNEYNLSFSNNGEKVDGKGGDFLYEADISGQYFVPEYPSTLEAGAYQFDGWYTSPFFGDTKFEFATENEDGTVTNATMPAEDITLYAKWVPITHTVRFYLDREDYDNQVTIPNRLPREPYTLEFADKTISHNHYLNGVGDPEVAEGDEANHPYSQYDFAGWYYIEDGQEKRFVVGEDGMPVTQDLDLYAKWSSNVLRAYTVYFALDEKNNETGAEGADGVADVDANRNIIYVADPITGSSLAGNSRTFDAKGGTALYALYQTGYYPNVASHTITLSIDDKDNEGANTFTFLYTPAAAVPYTVRYLIAGTETEVAPTREVTDNYLAVVTENFFPVSGYMPDAYQKTLVITPNGNNEIIFWYTVDTVHALYQVNHYVQNLDVQTWTLYSSNTFTGEIGKEYQAAPVEITGFAFSATVTDDYNSLHINGATGAALPGSPEDYSISAYAGGVIKGKLSPDGMQLNLYYTRNSYTYTVRYLEYGTNTVLHTEKTATVLYNTYVTEYAVNIERDLDGDGNNEDFQLYEATENPQSATIKDNTTVLTFYYVRCTQDLTVTKTVTGEGADPNQTFNFTLTSTAADFGGENDAYTYKIGDTQHTITAENGVISFSLKAGQTIKFLNLPTAKYTVTEQELPLGYYCAEPAKEVTLTKDAEVAVTITNEYAPAALEVKKVVNRIEDVVDNVTEFEFTIKVPDVVTGSYTYKVTDKDGNVVPDKDGNEVRTATVSGGEMTITLKDGETARFANLPTGEYIVAEQDYTDEGYSATYVDTDGTTTDGVVTLVKGETDTVTCTNAYPVGSLKISKTVKKAYAADAWSEDTFTFTVTRTDGSLNNSSYPVYSDTTKIGDATVENNTLTVEIKVTELDTKTTIKIDNLPEGDYKVTEAADADYTQSDREIETSIGPEDYAGSAEFTNTYTKHLGNLTITKNVNALSGYTAPADAAFTFTVSGAALTKSTYTVSIVDAQGNVGAEATCNVNDGKLTVSLLGGQSAVIHDLDLAEYTVEEAANSQFVLTSYSGTSGTIQADDTATAAFTNTYVPRGSLKVTKFIDRGLYDNVQIDTNQEFAFTVTLGYGLDVTETYACKVYTKAADSSTVDTLVATKQLTLSANKELTFTLKHNQYIVIENLPAVGYSIEETPVTGYLSPNFMYGSETQAIPKDGTAEVTCYNPVELAPGDLQITKIINDTTDNQSAPRNQEFVFTVTLRNADSVPTGPYTVEYIWDETKGSLSTDNGVTTYTMNDGAAVELATTVTPTEDFDGEYTFTLTLYDGLTATICDLPPCAYYVEENDYSDQGFAGEWDTEPNGLLGGTLIDGQNPLVDLTCTNVYPINTNGKLIIVKQVTKDYARDVLPDDTFTFTVTPTDGNTLTGDYTVKISDVYAGENNSGTLTEATVTANDNNQLVVEIPFTAKELVMDLNDSRSKQLIIEGLPLGQYDVVETADKDYKQLPDGLKRSVSVGTNPGEAIFINEYKRHLGTLTISKEVTGDPPETDTFIFHISGDGVDMDVTITGSGSVTIYDLPLGTYTVTEDTDWSWRYTASAASTDVDLAVTPDATVSFTNTYNNNKWLNYFTNMLNEFGKSS